MISALWILAAFAVGGCAGVLLIALLRIAADQDSGALLLAERESLGRRDKPVSFTTQHLHSAIPHDNPRRRNCR